MSCDDDCAPTPWRPVFWRGETWVRTFRWEIDDVFVDFTGWTAELSVKRASDESLIYTANAGNGVSIATDTITVNIADDVTATWPKTSVRVRVTAVSPSGETTFLVHNQQGAVK